MLQSLHLPVVVVIDNTEGGLETGHDLIFHVCQVLSSPELPLQALLVCLQLADVTDQGAAADNAGEDQAPQPHAVAAAPLHMCSLPAVTSHLPNTCDIEQLLLL